MKRLVPNHKLNWMLAGQTKFLQIYHAYKKEQLNYQTFYLKDKCTWA